MKTEHTPQPWHLKTTSSKNTIICADRLHKNAIIKTPIVELCGWLSQEEEYANANRIVACVNALAGIDDPAAFVEAAKKAMAKECECFPKK